MYIQSICARSRSPRTPPFIRLLVCTYAAVACTGPSELLLRVSPRSGMLATERAVARSFSPHSGLCVNLS